MPKYEISDVQFNGLTTIIPGGAAVDHWSPTRPAHDPSSGKQTCREVVKDGVTLALFILYEAGPVVREVEIPASAIRAIVRRPAPEPPAEKKPDAGANGGKAGGK